MSGLHIHYCMIASGTYTLNVYIMLNEFTYSVYTSVSFVHRLLFWSPTDVRTTRWMPRPELQQTTGFLSLQSVSAREVLALWIPSPSPLQPPPQILSALCSGLSPVFAAQNSCPVHLNSSDSAWVFVSMYEIIVFRSVWAKLMQVYEPESCMYCGPIWCQFLSGYHKKKGLTQPFTPTGHLESSTRRKLE